MRSPMNEIKQICIATTMMLLIELIFLLCLSSAVYYGVLDFMAAEILLTIALILSAAIGVNIFGRTNTSFVSGYLAGGFFVLVVLLLLLLMGSAFTSGGVVKSILAVAIGVFLGNFIKNFGHNKLGKNKKRRKPATK